MFCGLVIGFLFLVSSTSLHAEASGKAGPILSLCTHLVLNNAQDDFLLQPKVTTQLLSDVQFVKAALSEEIGELAPQVPPAEDFASYSLPKRLLKQALARFISAPQDLLEKRERLAQLQEKLQWIQNIEWILTEIPAVQRTARLREEILQWDHPEAEFEIPVADWVMEQATEKIRAILAFVLVDFSAVSAEKKEEVKELLQTTLQEVADYRTYTESHYAGGPDFVVNKMRPLYLEAAANAKVDEIQAWAKKEFGAPLEEELIHYLIGVLLFQSEPIAKRLQQLSELHEKLQRVRVLIDSPSKRHDLVFSVDKKELIWLFQDMIQEKATVAEVESRVKSAFRALFQRANRLPVDRGDRVVFVLRLSTWFKKSIDQVVDDLAKVHTAWIQFDTSDMVANYPDKTRIGLMGLYYRYQSRINGNQRDSLAVDLKQVREALAMFPKFIQNQISDPILAGMSVLVLATDVGFKPRTVLDSVQAFYRLAEARKFTSEYVFYDWVQIATFALHVGISEEVMLEIMLAAKSLRQGQLPPVGRLLSVLQSFRGDRAGEFPFSRSDLFEYLSVPLANKDFPAYSLIPTATKMDRLFMPPITNLAEGLAPDEKLKARLEKMLVETLRGGFTEEAASSQGGAADLPVSDEP